MQILLWGTAAVLAVAAAATLAWSSRLRARVGEVIARERAPGRARAGLVAAAALAALMVLVFGRSPDAAAALIVLALAALLAAVTPRSRDQLCGARGVQYGWLARRYDELEEWRLTGEHLRWRARGEWVACRVPPAEHPRLRETLERLVGERESRFKT